MVKVLENRVVDLDLLPGTKEQQEAATRARQAATEDLPEVSHQDAPAGENAQNAGKAVVGALGGTVKGVVDTAGNTVGTLGEGLYGTVTGLGKGLGGGAMYAGAALDGAGRGIGRGLGFGGTKEKQLNETDQSAGATVDEGTKAITGSERRKSEHEENVKALEEFEGKQGIKMTSDDKD